MSETTLVSAPPAEEGCASLRGRLWPRAGEAAVAARVVYAGMAAYAVLFVFAAVVHYVVFQEARFDLGDMVQAIWNTAHGHVLESTTKSGHQVSRLGAHVDPFLLVFVPVFWISSSPIVLLVVQALAVTSGALPIFWLARKHLDSPRAAVHFAFAYLLYPAVQFNAFMIGNGFHSVSLAVPLILFAIWFLDEDRLVAFSAVALLACTTKEEIPLAVGCLGIWYAARSGRRRFGFGVFAAGLALTLFNFLWVIPHFAPSGFTPFIGRYRAVGGTPGGMAHKLVADPMAFAHAVTSGHKAVYLLLLFVPVLGLAFFEPLLLLGAVPDLAINLLSASADQATIGYQYSAGIAPFVIAASILGASRFRRQSGRLSLLVLVATALVAILSPINRLAHEVRLLGSPAVAAKAHALSLVPAGVRVSSTDELGGYLSERRRVYTFPVIDGSRWVVVDRHDPRLPHVKKQLRRLESHREWRIVYSSHGIVVLHRRPLSTP